MITELPKGMRIPKALFSQGTLGRWEPEFESKFDGYYFRDEVLNVRRLDLEEYLALNWKINEKLTLSNILDYNDVKGKKY